MGAIRATVDRPENVPPPLPPMKGESKLTLPVAHSREVLTPLTMRQAIFESVMQELDANIVAAVLDLPGFAVSFGLFACTIVAFTLTAT